MFLKLSGDTYLQSSAHKAEAGLWGYTGLQSKNLSKTKHKAEYSESPVDYLSPFLGPLADSFKHWFTTVSDKDSECFWGEDSTPS